MHKYKIVFVGTGKMANEYAKVLYNEFKNQIQFVGAMNRSNDRIKDFIKKYKIPKYYRNLKEMMMITKPDIVIVSVNETSTYKILKILTKFDIICLIEKPVGFNFYQSEKISKLKKNDGFKGFIALNRRYYSSVQKAQNIISKDLSPRIIHIYDQESTLIAKKSGKPTQVVKNWMYANSIHMIDFAYQFGRGKIKKIKKLNKGNIFKESYVSALLYFDSGDVVFYHCFWNRKAPWKVEISTQNFYIQLKPIEKLSYLSKKNVKWNNVKKSNSDINYKPGIHLLLKDIVNPKKNNLMDLKYSYKLMKLINRVYFD